MNLNSNILWCTATWNVLRGCSWASPGCDHCYAEQIARRFSKGKIAPFYGVVDPDTGTWNGTIEFVPKKLDEPLKVKTPQLVFANSMSDICHPNVLPEWVDEISAVMERTPWHFYLMLTKRPNLIERKMLSEHFGNPTRGLVGDDYPGNLAMGTSIEHPKFLWRGYRLLEQWTGDGFLSLEPLIAELSIADLLKADTGGRIKQVIVGGESGREARPMQPQWVRQLRDETLAAGRAFFFKQWGDGLFSKPWLNKLGRTLDDLEWNESPWPVPLPINEGSALQVRDPQTRRDIAIYESRKVLV